MFPALAPLLSFPRRKRSPLRDFEATLRIELKTTQYGIETAANAQSLEQALRLRHLVFFGEIQNRALPSGLDLDDYDLTSDHILIRHLESQEIVGTYRLRSSLFTDRFYSETEFYLDPLKDLPGQKLELGRACILPAHRNGAVIRSLWRGIAEYMRLSQTRYLFGCASVQTLDLNELRKIDKILHTQNAFEPHSERWISPRNKYHPRNHFGSEWTLTHLASTIDEEIPFPMSEAAKSPTELPPLMQSYLNAGVKLFKEPAIDVDFGCADYFTLLDRERMNPLFKRRFGL